MMLNPEMWHTWQVLFVSAGWLFIGLIVGLFIGMAHRILREGGQRKGGVMPNEKPVKAGDWTDDRRDSHAFEAIKEGLQKYDEDFDEIEVSELKAIIKDLYFAVHGDAWKYENFIGDRDRKNFTIDVIKGMHTSIDTLSKDVATLNKNYKSLQSDYDSILQTAKGWVKKLCSRLGVREQEDCLAQHNFDKCMQAVDRIYAQRDDLQVKYDAINFNKENASNIAIFGYKAALDMAIVAVSFHKTVDKAHEQLRELRRNADEY